MPQVRLKKVERMKIKLPSLTALLPTPSPETVAKVWLENYSYEEIELKMDARYAAAKSEPEKKRLREVYAAVLKLKQDGYVPRARK